MANNITLFIRKNFISIALANFGVLFSQKGIASKIVL